jgi:hypothetical protein
MAAIEVAIGKGVSADSDTCSKLAPPPARS